jgi:N-acetylglutamate synthase-like GNAT family acetyltransferase
LADSDEGGYELNEVSWWSNWTETVWLGKDAYLLFSQDFSEYFFNHGGFLRVTDRAAGLIDTMEAEFAGRRLTPHVFVQSESLTPRLLQGLARKGYRIADQMSVMEVESPSFVVNPKLTLELGLDHKLEQWADVYLKAFYGDTKLMKPVLAVLRRVAKNKEASFLIASLDERPVGALALFRSPGMSGVYCVGTLPDMRGVHVASTMLDFSNKLAVSEARKLILQTVLSDSVEPFYLKLGFRRVYLKELFARGSGHILKS